MGESQGHRPPRNFPALFKGPHRKLALDLVEDIAQS
jgi:hypothetical protein